MASVAGLAVQATSLTPTFPAISLPIAVIVVDAVNRIQQVIDYRPRYLLSTPAFAPGAFENIRDPTKRVGFQNNYYVPRSYALSPRVPQEVNFPSSGFLLGAGSVVINGTTISTPQTYITSTRGGQLTGGQINQGYITSSGALAIAPTQTSGVFPPNTLPLFEATVDSVNLIRNLVDWRPSYI